MLKAKKPLLTAASANTKTAKIQGALAYILHLHPDTDICPWANECLEGCLNTAGRAGMIKRGEYTNTILEARKRKSALFKTDRGAFMCQLHEEVSAAIRKGVKNDLPVVVRLNGTSDIPWEGIRYTDSRGISHKNIFMAFPSVTFYDYTKGLKRKSKYSNYYLTYSLQPSNKDQALALARSGENVAVVFDLIPDQWQGFKVIDGDITDARYNDPKGVIVGLKAKGKAKKDTSGFVVRTSNRVDLVNL